MVVPARPACGGRRVCLIKGVSRVTPYEARDFRQCRGCHTRVQETGPGGQMSNSVQSNVKSGKISPYRTYPASTLVPEQLPAPLDSARNEIGQCATCGGGQFRTAPATESDSLSRRGDRAGQAAGTVAAVPVPVKVVGVALSCCGLGGACRLRRWAQGPGSRRRGGADRAGQRPPREAPGPGVCSRHHVSDLTRQSRHHAGRSERRAGWASGAGTGQGSGSATECPRFSPWESDRVGAAAIRFG